MAEVTVVVVTPEEWLADFESKIAEVKQKTAEFQASLETAGATESTADGKLSVTVAPNGALTGLSIDDSALRGSGEELAGKIMRLARKAQRQAAVQVAEAFAPLAGEDPEALRMVTGFIPPAEDEPEPEEEGRGYSFTQDESEPPPSTRSGEPPRPPMRPRSAARDDDEDFGNEQIFGRRTD